jgi:hypothetical protein
MTKIKNTVAYTIKRPLALTDYAVGTNSENLGVGMAKDLTISMQLIDIRDVVLAGLSPDIGGTLKIGEIEYTGILSSPADVANALDPAYIVSAYEILIFNINGKRYLLKLQDVAIGDGELNISDSDFITIVAIQSTGLDVTASGDNTVIESKAGVNVGSDGVNIYKGLNATSKLHEFRKAKSVGFDVTIDADGVKFEKKAGVNLGNGMPVYKGLNASTKLDEFYNLKSSTLNIVKEIGEGGETGNITINTPTTATIPGLYVNNLYEPTYEDWVSGGGNLISNPSFLYKGEGSLTRPFTDSRNYTSATTFVDTANTAIQNALENYVGATPLTPSKLGQQIIVQNNTTGYTFAGDFNYSGLNIKLEANVLSTNSGYIVDMDNALRFNNASDLCTFTIDQNVSLVIQGDGFKNNGNTVATNNQTSFRQVRLFGAGSVTSTGNTISKYILSSDVSSTGNGTTGFNNDGAWQFEVRCSINSDFQGIYKIGGKGRIYSFGGSFRSGNVFTNVNTSLEAFYQGGGVVAFFEDTFLQIYGGASTLRDIAFQFVPTNGFTPEFNVNSANLIGNSVVVFNKNNTSNVTFSLVGSQSPNMFCTSVFNSPNLWQVNFKNNIFGSGAIDVAVADLTLGNNVSSTNTIGNFLVETLVFFDSRQTAKNFNFPVNSAFLIKRDVNAVNLLEGVEYKIKTAGSPSLGTVGDFIVATGLETGTGVGIFSERCVMI